MDPIRTTFLPTALQDLLRRHFDAVLLVCFFVSGTSGLILQVAWSRSLGLTLGTTTHAGTTVVVVYMLGLGIGSLVFGRLADGIARPARLYGILEVAIGALALLSPGLLWIAGRVFVAIQSRAGLGASTRMTLQALAAGTVLLVPTILLGGTLPLLARQVVGRRSELVRRVGLLNAVNTIGAVAGAGVAGFVLIERLGLRGSIGLAALLSIAVGVVILAIRPDPVPVEEGVRAPTWARLRWDPRVLLVVLLSLAAGVAALASEIAWMRVVGMILGSSTYAFALVLVAFLTGLGLGSWVASKVGAGRIPLVRVAWAQLLAGTGTIVFLMMLESAFSTLLIIQQHPLLGFETRIAIKAMFTLAIILPSTVAMGMTFPFVVAALAGERNRVGEDVGLANAASTAGSIIGAAGAGFVLLTAFGTFSTLRLCAALHLAIACAALTACWRHQSRWGRWPLATASATALLVLAMLAPWPRHLLSSGALFTAQRTATTPLEVARFLQEGSNGVIFHRAGISSTVSVWDVDFTRALRVNGKPDASTSADMATQLSIGVLPLLAHPSPENVLVIGAGSGVTAHVLRTHPDVRRVDVVELEPAVIEAGALFESVNHGVYDDPRVRVIIDDGRNFLLTSRDQYDLIVSEPSNPWMAGVANLFTREFHDLARARLAPGGIVMQWVQQYDLPPTVLKRLAATVLESYPEVQLWTVTATDFMLPCSEEPLSFSLERAARVLDASPELRRALRDFANVNDAEDLLVGQVLDRDGLEVYAGDWDAYQDDPPELEFAALRGLGDGSWHQLVLTELLDVRDAVPPTLRVSEDVTPGLDAYFEARLLDQWNRTDQSASLHVRAAKAAPGSANRWYRLGDVLARQEKHEAAEAAFELAVEADGSHAFARARLADAAISRGDLAAADAHFAVIREGDEWLLSELLRADLAMRHGRPRESLGHLRSVVERLPFVRYPDPIVPKVLKGYSVLGSDSDLAPDVIAELGELTEVQPRVRAWPLALARVLERDGQHEAAIERYDERLVMGTSLEALKGRARCLLAVDRLDEALATIRTAQAFEPGDADLWKLEQEARGGRSPSLARASRPVPGTVRMLTGTASP